MQIHTIKSGDGTICMVIDGRHYTVAVSNPSYQEIREVIDTKPMDEPKLLLLMNITERISSLCEGKVRVDLDEGKVWYNDTEFKDDAFCERILRLMSEGQDVQYLVNFLNRLGQNPESRAIMETFKFLQHEGLPITPDGCFLAYKGVRNDYYDKWTGKILNRPDGRRIEEDRELMCSDPNQACAKGLHCGSIKYGREWGSGGHCILVKVDPKDVVCVPNHDCRKMRVCGYWVIRDFDSALEDGNVLQGEVYDSTGQRVAGAVFTSLEERGQFDNDVGSHWDEEEGRTYTEGLTEVDEDFEVCDGCGEFVDECVCDYDDYYDDYIEDNYCPDCGEYYCVCDDDNEVCPHCDEVYCICGL